MAIPLTTGPAPRRSSRRRSRASSRPTRWARIERPTGTCATAPALSPAAAAHRLVDAVDAQSLAHHPPGGQAARPRRRPRPAGPRRHRAGPPARPAAPAVAVGTAARPPPSVRRTPKYATTTPTCSRRGPGRRHRRHPRRRGRRLRRRAAQHPASTEPSTSRPRRTQRCAAEAVPDAGRAGSEPGTTCSSHASDSRDRRGGRRGWRAGGGCGSRPRTRRARLSSRTHPTETTVPAEAGGPRPDAAKDRVSPGREPWADDAVAQTCLVRRLHHADRTAATPPTGANSGVPPHDHRHAGRARPRRRARDRSPDARRRRPADRRVAVVGRLLRSRDAYAPLDEPEVHRSTVPSATVVTTKCGTS